MLTLGITIMVASIVIGIVTLTCVALMSSGARSAGRRARTAITRRQGPFDQATAREGASYRVQSAATRYATADEDPPRWVLALAILSGAGLLLGLLMVMIASIP